jgi:hypothetical protein
VYPKLIQSDATWVVENRDMQSFLLRVRTDLVDPFLSFPVLTGSLSKQKKPFFFFSDCHYDFSRLTFDQQRKIENSLPADLRYYEDISLLSSLEWLEPTRLMAYARVDNTLTGQRDMALSALARMDVGNYVFDYLLEALNDDRARVAIYAIRKVNNVIAKRKRLYLFLTCISLPSDIEHNEFGKCAKSPSKRVDEESRRGQRSDSLVWRLTKWWRIC